MAYSRIVVTVAALLPALMLPAQTAPSTQSPSGSVAQVKASLVESDKLLASWLMAGCNNEIAMARIGVRKAQAVEVKQFAQKMLDDHGQLDGKLQPFTEGDAKHGGRVVGKDSDVGKGERETADASTRVRGAKGEFDHISLIRDLSKRCLESQTKALEAKMGADFDESFMQGQVALHTQAVIMVEVFGNYASPELRPTLEAAGKTLRAHLEQATALCKKCEASVLEGKAQNGAK